MPEQRHERQVESCVGDAWIRRKGREYADHRYCGEQGLLVEAYSKARHICNHMEPEDAQEEVAERVEHLNEEVPPQSNIGSQI